MPKKNYKVTKQATLADQATKILREYIHDNFRDGGQIHGEHELSEMLAVNRNTVRQALKTLENDGIISRIRGKGTFANKHVQNIKFRLDQFLVFSDLIRKAGFEPKRVHLDWGSETAGKKFGKKFDIDPGMQLLISTYLFFADDQPAVYMKNYIPAVYLIGYEELVKNSVPMFTVIEENTNIKLKYSACEIVPQICGDEIAKIFSLEPTSPILQLNELYLSDDDTPIMYTEIIVRDPTIRFHIVRVMD